MSERSLYQTVKNTGEQVVTNLAMLTGFKPRSVDLVTLLENSQDYRGKYIQTEGLYTTRGRRVVKSIAGGSGGSPFSIDIPVTQYFLNEHGVLKLSETADNDFRLYLVKFCGTGPERADQLAQSEYTRVLPARVQGRIEQGFPDEFYLWVSRFESLLDN